MNWDLKLAVTRSPYTICPVFHKKKKTNKKTSLELKPTEIFLKKTKTKQNKIKQQFSTHRRRQYVVHGARNQTSEVAGGKVHQCGNPALCQHSQPPGGTVPPPRTPPPAPRVPGPLLLWLRHTRSASEHPASWALALNLLKPLHFI